MIKILFYFLKQGREIHFMHLIKVRSQKDSQVPKSCRGPFKWKRRYITWHIN